MVSGVLSVQRLVAGLRAGSAACRRAGLLAGLLAGVTLLGVAGCGDLDEASAAGGTRDDLVSAMAAQLSGGSALSYTATYQVTGGGTATVTRAQRPARTAYVYPGGRLLVTGTATIRCQGDDRAPVCTETLPDPAAAATLQGTSLVTPEAVLAMLNLAAVDPDIAASQHDTTIAGRHATCLDLRGVDRAPARDFTACVTNEGALASFAATIGGQRKDLALTNYSESVTGEAFVLPPAAKVTDKRAK
jgi:hypothetical protein